MKKVISVLLSFIMLFSLASVAFAAAGYEEDNQGAVKNFCPYCGEAGGYKGYFVYDDELHMQVGCDCCEKCPSKMNDKGIPVNLSYYSPCRYAFYLDTDVMNAAGEIIHRGDNTYHYYWKAKCCEDCTEKIGCKCNNTDEIDACGCKYCEFTPDHTDEKIEQGLEAGRNGFIGGIQTALQAVRDVMYELFDALFTFLRLDDVLGKWPGRQN